MLRRKDWMDISVKISFVLCIWAGIAAFGSIGYGTWQNRDVVVELIWDE